MIVLINAKITDDRIINYKKGLRPGYPQFNRFDVFKYTLFSYSAISEVVSKYILYIELGKEFLDKKQELQNLLDSIFTKEKLIIYWHRNNSINDWRITYKELSNIDDDIIWLLCNDDHVFIDNSLSVLKNGIELLQNDTDDFAAIYYSHWIESIRMAHHLNGKLMPDGNYVKFNWGSYDGILAMKKQRFYKYWFEYNDDGRLWFRPDHFLHVRQQITGNFYVPTKEIVRHFDGHGHIGNFTNIVPVLTIPNGFFEKNIKIKYGYPNRIDNYTNINPKISNLYSIDSNGVDYKYCLADIPLFWKDQISEIDINPQIDHHELNTYRNSYFLDMTKCCNYVYDIKFKSQPPIEWFKNHLL